VARPARGDQWPSRGVGLGGRLRPGAGCASAKDQRVAKLCGRSAGRRLWTRTSATAAGSGCVTAVVRRRVGVVSRAKPSSRRESQEDTDGMARFGSRVGCIDGEVSFAYGDDQFAAGDRLRCWVHRRDWKKRRFVASCGTDDREAEVSRRISKRVRLREGDSFDEVGAECSYCRCQGLRGEEELGSLRGS